PGREGETVMPQLSDSFLDRLGMLTRQVNESPFRIKLIDEYARSMKATIRPQQAVSYETQVLNELKAPAAGAAPQVDERAVAADIQRSKAEARRLIGKVGEIYQIILKNTNPSTQLFSVAGPATLRVERPQTFNQLFLYGIVALLLALPVMIA